MLLPGVVLRTPSERGCDLLQRHPGQVGYHAALEVHATAVLDPAVPLRLAPRSLVERGIREAQQVCGLTSG